MARSFASDSDHLDLASAPVNALPITACGWIYPTSLPSDDDIARSFFVASDGSNDHRINFRLNNDATWLVDGVQWNVRDAPGDAVSTTSAVATANAWQHVAGRSNSATDHAVLINGGDKGTSSDSEDPMSELTQLEFGTFSTFSANFPGRMAEWAMWNVGLTDDEIAKLAKGYSPLLMRPESLVAYWPLMGAESPEPDYIGRFNLAVTGTANAQHPAIIMPRRPQLILPAAGGDLVFTHGTETDSAIALASKKERAFTQSGETDSAIALSSVKSKNLATAEETDTAVALTASKALGFTAATENDSAVAMAAVKTKSFTPAAETDTALALGVAGDNTFSPAVESDAAVPLSVEKSKSFTPATETSVAVGLASEKSLAFGPAVDVETAHVLVSLKTRAFVHAAVTDSAIALTLADQPSPPILINIGFLLLDDETGDVLLLDDEGGVVQVGGRVLQYEENRSPVHYTEPRSPLHYEDNRQPIHYTIP